MPYAGPMKSKPILLHVCCGPCSTSSILRLIEEGWAPVLYFSNSNIYPSEEADKRYDELLKVAEQEQLPVIREAYDHQRWLSFIQGLEAEAEGERGVAAALPIILAKLPKRLKSWPSNTLPPPSASVALRVVSKSLQSVKRLKGLKPSTSKKREDLKNPPALQRK